MQKQADIQLQDNQFLLTGELSFFNVMAVYEKSLLLLNQHPEFHFDFSKLISSDSSALALIIEWVKFAKIQNKKIHFHFLPEKLLSIARVSKLENLI